MGRLELSFFVITALFHLSAVCACSVENRTSGEIRAVTKGQTLCWTIAVPEDTYVYLQLNQLSIYSGSSLSDCSSNVNIDVAASGENFKFCSQGGPYKKVTALNDVKVTLRSSGYTTTMGLDFNIETLVCLRKAHFRCSNHTCVHPRQVCDGVTDCENGADEMGCDTGIPVVKGLEESIQMAVAKLKGQQSASFGWGPNTHRAITALYLSGNVNFRGDTLQEEMVVKQLELQTALALLKSSTESAISVSDLSMFVNALTVTCHNLRHFYGHDLLAVLSKRLNAVRYPAPGAYLTLCNANLTLPDDHTRSLLEMLQEPSGYPFHLDVQAMALMALSCAKIKTDYFERFENGSRIYNATIRQFISRQLPDGSFGNIYTTALVAQALISSGHRNNSSWKINSALQYLMKELNSSTDFLSISLTLPVLRGRSLADLANVNCTHRRKQGEDDISDIIDKVGGKMRVQYSLYVGDERDVMHTIYLRVPERSSAYDVMRVAQVADHKYKFLHRGPSGKKYVYEIAGITNDPEAGRFWLQYVAPATQRNSVVHRTESPDNVILNEGDHLIMWYKTAQDNYDFPFLTSTRYPERYTTYDITWYPRHGSSAVYPGTRYHTGYPSTGLLFSRLPTEHQAYSSTYYPGTRYRTGYPSTGYSSDYPGTRYRTGYPSTGLFFNRSSTAHQAYSSTDYPGTRYRTGYSTGYYTTRYPIK